MDNKTPQIENGFIKIANQIADDLCKISLSAYQSRIVFCILRKTYGFNKKEDWISNSQFVYMTGIKPSHVSRAVSELVAMNIVTKRGNKTSFQKDSRLWKKLPNGVRRHDVTNRGNTVTNRGNSKLPIGVSPIYTTKYTITKDTIQKKYSSLKNIDLLVMEEISNKYHVPLSFVQSKFDDMSNWLMAKGKSYRNYKAALMNWVKTDALKIMEKERQTVNKFNVTKV